MRKGSVWSLKRSLDENDPASKAPAPDSPAFDSLNGVAPIENPPAPNPATDQPKKPGAPAASPLTPAAVDDFFQQQSQGWLMDLQPDPWEGEVPIPNAGSPNALLLLRKAGFSLGIPMDFTGNQHHPLGAVVLGSFLLAPLPFQPFRRKTLSRPLAQPQLSRGRGS
jgi:hypothetical protein